VHGAARLSQDFPRVEAFALSRTLRFAGGPGEVRKNAVADAELSRQASAPQDPRCQAGGPP